MTPVDLSVMCVQPGHQAAAEIELTLATLLPTLETASVHQTIWPPGPRYLKILDGEVQLLELWSRTADPGYSAFEGPDLNAYPLDRAKQFRLWDAVRAFDDRRFERQGLVRLAYMYYPEFYLYSTRPIRGLVDLEHRRIRAHTFPEFHFVNSVRGATFTPIVNSETGAAMRSGEIELFAATLFSYVKNGWHEVAPYAVGPFISASRSVVLLRGDTFARYGAGDQVRWRDAFAACERRSRASFEDLFYNGPLARLTELDRVPSPVPADIAAHADFVFRKITAPTWAHRVWGDYEALDAYNAAFREVLGFTIARDGTVTPA